MLMGKSGCGKSTLERNLVKLFPNLFHKVVSATTRPMREGEQNGVDYHFYTDEEFDALELVQSTEFAGYRYGSELCEYMTEHPFPILVAVPSSAADLTNAIRNWPSKFPNFRTCNIYFNISDERLFDNMKARGDTIEMIEKRISQDDLDVQFAESGLSLDIEITDWYLDSILPYRICSLIRRFANA